MTDDGIKWGSAQHHPRTCELIEGGTRRVCQACRKLGAQQYATHYGKANGVVLMVGCEWHVRKWVKEGT